MKKKKMSFILLLIVGICISPIWTYANESSKTIVINMNKTNLNHMNEIPVLKKELENRGYIGLMNIRGDGGNDDKRAYATIGSGRRANVISNTSMDFVNANKENSTLYKSNTNVPATEINNLAINKILTHNLDKGQYGATLGEVGQTLSDNNLEVAVLGNADTGKKPEDMNRNIGLMAMDNFGRIKKGNVDNINIDDYSMPFGISTDYNKLIEETKKYYNESDVLFIELGDTYRLDLYKSYLNEETSDNMRSKIYKNIDNYLSQVFNLVGDNDKVYVISAFPSDIDYKNKRRLSPVIKFDGDGKGLLKSATTRREGIIGNVDIGVDILSGYNLESEQTVGKSFGYIDNDNNLNFLNDEYEKIVSIATVRGNIINAFITTTVVAWIITIGLLIFKNILIKNKKFKYEIPKNKELMTFKILKEFLKLGMIMPLAFLISPIFKFTTDGLIIVGIIIAIIIIYLIGLLLFKGNDIKQLLFYAIITISIIVIDCIIGTPLMKNSILSYDAIVGARYYGMGNEYQGIVIGSALLTFTTLLMYKRIPKWLVVVLSIIVLIPTASPSMGANVGASISEFVAFITLIFLIMDIKIDFKKILIIGIGVVAVLGIFVGIDFISGSQSHLSLFVRQIFENGPSVIIETFSRKISMNIKLAKTSTWVNILVSGIAIIGVLAFKPINNLKEISKKYPIIFKGFIANIVGCAITLLVNDSGIVSAATASIYILIPLIIITVNMLVFEKEN